MTPGASSFGFGVLMFAAGIGIPIMAALNSGLGARLGSPTAAAFILFLVGALVTGVALLAVGLPSRIMANAPPQYYIGGFFVAFYVLSVTWAAPRIGVGNAVFYVLIGQIVSAAMIDHFGLFGAMAMPITLRRAAGIVFMDVGVFLARRVA